MKKGFWFDDKEKRSEEDYSLMPGLTHVKTKPTKYESKEKFPSDPVIYSKGEKKLHKILVK